MKKHEPKARSFSKKLTVLSMSGIFAMCGYGIFTGLADLANVLSVLSAASVAHLLIYMGVGHLDYRQVIASGLLKMTSVPVTSETLTPLDNGSPLPPLTAAEDKAQEADNGAH